MAHTVADKFRDQQLGLIHNTGVVGGAQLLTQELASSCGGTQTQGQFNLRRRRQLAHTLTVRDDNNWCRGERPQERLQSWARAEQSTAGRSPSLAWEQLLLSVIGW